MAPDRPSEIEMLRIQVATLTELLEIHEEQAAKQFEIIRAQRRDLEERARSLELSLAEAKRSQQALQLSQQRFSKLFNSGVIGILLGSHQGVIQEANDAFLQMVGYSRDELDAGLLNWVDLSSSEYRHLPEHVYSQLKERGWASPYEKEYLHRNGSRIPVCVAVTALDRRHFLALVMDISDRKRLEEVRLRARELEEENRRMQEISRLKSEFLANMSHELRTPLNAVIGFAELMFNGKVGPISSTHREYLGDILSSSRHLLQLINGVLDLTKVEAGKMQFCPEPLELARVIGEVRDTLRVLATDKRIRLDTRIDSEISPVTLDPVRLKQVLYNILSNALKFTPDGGEVEIRAAPEGSRHFRIDVADTGIGIEPAELNRLFVNFQQLDSGAAKRYPGTGLGLALTKRIVEAQGGRIWATSAKGQGATFTIVLPRVQGAIEDSPTSSVAGAA